MKHIFIKFVDTVLIGLQVLTNMIVGQTIPVYTFMPINLPENCPDWSNPRKKSNDAVSLIYQY